MPAHQLTPPAPDSPAAPFLFSAETIKEITDLEQRGIYTAERCPQDKRQAILTLLKEGRSFREVAQLVTRVADETVKAVYEAHAIEIDEARKLGALILPKARYAAHKQLDRLIESPSLVPGAGIAVLLKNLYDITALEEGKPTERSEHTETKNVFASFRILTAQLKEKEAGHEILSPKTGLAGGKTPVLNQPGSDPGQVLPVDAELVPADPRSEHSGPVSQGEARCVTASVTDPGPESAPDPDARTDGSGSPETPRGGDREAERPASLSTDNGSRNFQPNKSEDP